MLLLFLPVPNGLSLVGYLPDFIVGHSAADFPQVLAQTLHQITAHFSDASAMLVQFIVSMPALLIIVTDLFFVHFYVSKKGGTTRMVEKVPSLNIEEEAGRVAQEV